MQMSVQEFHKIIWRLLGGFNSYFSIISYADTSPLDPIELCSTITSAIGESNGIDAVDEFGQTPLHRAALRGATVCCMHLIQRGADINRQDDNGNTPLGMTVFEKHER
jgi:hypothetical protein